MNPGTYLTDSGVELLTQSGNLISLPYPEIKSVYFVRDFDRGPVDSGKRSFLSRPKLDGLWVRLTFQDGDQMEGVMSNDLLSVSGPGFSLSPPDFAGNNHRVFIPRTALNAMQVLGVVGSPLRQPAKKTAGKEQISLFEDASGGTA